MRLLVVSHPPLAAEYGAAQLALNLGAACRRRGHEVTVWSPEPLPPETRWWHRWLRQRQAIEAYVAAHGPFDVIDVPAISVGRRLARAATIVARSVQPELLYLAAGLDAQLRRRPFPSLLLPFHAAHAGRLGLALLGGWHRARWILCLGSLELDWMRRRFPRWERKLRSYEIAPSSTDREILAAVRRRRVPPSPEKGTRFLWIGRWVPHKGTERLVRFLSERAAARPLDSFTLAGCGPAAAADCPPELLRQGRLRIVPFFHRAELPALLAAHDAGLFTSTVEGWGLSLNEMLESGMPVFATLAGGVPDLRRFFPQTLHPFPPPLELPVPAAAEPADYEEHFTWDRIACRYETEILAPLAK